MLYESKCFLYDKTHISEYTVAKQYFVYFDGLIQTDGVIKAVHHFWPLLYTVCLYVLCVIKQVL